jgi:hypothetical protein
MLPVGFCSQLTGRGVVRKEVDVGKFSRPRPSDGVHRSGTRRPKISKATETKVLTESLRHSQTRLSGSLFDGMWSMWAIWPVLPLLLSRSR